MKNGFQLLLTALLFCVLISCSKSSSTSTIEEPPTVLPQGPSGEICFINYNNVEGIEQELITMKSDGSDQRVLLKDDPTVNVPTDGWTKWSFDRKTIVFSWIKSGEGFEDIYIINKDGSGLTNISNTPLEGEQFPSLSPDGKTIVYTAGSGISSSRQLYTCAVDGSNKKQLTRFTHPYRAIRSTVPVWAPSGDWIYFNSTKDTSFTNIYAIKPDGSAVTRITTNTKRSEWAPSISPKGDKIVFYSYVNSIPCLFTVNSDGSNKTQLTNYHSFDPVWSPDGSYIAFGSAKDKPANIYDENDIYTMKADGSELKKLTNSKGAKWYFDWK